MGLGRGYVEAGYDNTMLLPQHVDTKLSMDNGAAPNPEDRI